MRDSLTNRHIQTKFFKKHLFDRTLKVTCVFYSLSEKKMFALTFYYTIVNALELEGQITDKIYFQWNAKLSVF